MKAAISVEHLVKKYGGQTAVNNISFHVARGELFAFLGTNGAGKSTTINCITTLSSPTSGEIHVGDYAIGKQDQAIRQHIGVVFQHSLLDPSLTVRENLTHRGVLYGMNNYDIREQISSVSTLVDIGGLLDAFYGTLSGGQKRRVDIARSLIHKPNILFLDEPTAGLDAKSREQVWEALAKLREASGLTVFLTTHYMEETDHADTVYVIHRGDIIAHGTPFELRQKYSHDELRIETNHPQSLTEALAKHKLQYSHPSSKEFLITVASSRQALQVIQDTPGLQDFEFRHGSMDDVFLELTKDEV